MPGFFKAEMNSHGGAGARSGMGRKPTPDQALDELFRGDIASIVRRLDPMPGQRTALTTDAGLGLGMMPLDVGKSTIALSAEFGAYKDLNNQTSPSGKTTYGLLSALPLVTIITPANQGTQISADAVMTGSGAATISRELAVIINMANQLAEDERANTSFALKNGFAMSLASALDWVCFSADGTDDTTDGGMTGIFADAGVTVVSAAAGRTLAEQLQEEDFLRCVDACAAAALQRGARFWMHPSIYRKVLRVRDGSGQALIKFQAGAPYIAGFPVTLVARAPSANGAGQKVVAFGSGDAYLVAVRDEIAVQVSEAPKFDYNMRQIRATMRAYCRMLDATWFATLATAAV